MASDRARQLLVRGAILLLSLAWTSTAEAIEIDWDVSGQIRIRGFHIQGGTVARQLTPNQRRNLGLRFGDNIDEQLTFVNTRARIKAEVTVGEVIGALQFEIGDIAFGVSSGNVGRGSGGGVGTDGVNIETRHLYLEFPVPYLKDIATIRAGLQPFTLPSGLILAADGAGARLDLDLDAIQSKAYFAWLLAVDQSQVDLDRLDLTANPAGDPDGLLDNDNNDRDIVMTGFRNSTLEFLTAEAYFVADVDNTRDSPVPGPTPGTTLNIERDMFYLGTALSTKFGNLSATGNFVYNWGRVDNGGLLNETVHTNAWAADLTVELAIDPLVVKLMTGWATGRDFDDHNDNDAFQPIAPFFQRSNILYDGNHGLTILGSQLSGTTFGAIEVSWAPLDDLDVELLLMYARTTERVVPEVEPLTGTFVPRQNFNAGTRAKDLGFEVDLNLEYVLYENFKIFSVNGVFFPGPATEAIFDSPDDGPILEFVLGAQLSF